MGVTPSNYVTTVDGIRPAVPGLELRVYEGGNWVVLSNHTAHDAVVLGYLGEPFLRVGPDGAYENTASPSLLLAQLPPGDGSGPIAGAPKVAVRWAKVADGPSIGWHDHRVHWALTTSPPEVTRSPGSVHVVIPGWRIPVRWDGKEVVVTGDVLWEPGPSPWPWFGVVAVLAGCVSALGWSSRRSRVVVLATIAVGLAVDLVWAVDRWSSSYVPLAGRINALFAVAGATVCGVSALVLMRRPGGGRGMVAAMFTGVFLLGDVLPLNGVWRMSDVPTTLSATSVRVLVLLTASCGLALLLVGWHHAVWIPGHRSPADRGVAGVGSAPRG
jgi:hypothetical protein